MRQKIDYVTDLLENTFGVKMVSHRAGRWSFNAAYARMLADRGFLVDCSVTPHVSWRETLGDPHQQGGTDYTQFPEDAYFLDLTDISQSDNSPLLEVPTTIYSVHRPLIAALQRPFRQVPVARGVLRRLLPPAHWQSWLRPTGKNRQDLLKVLDHARKQRKEYVEFMLHSSELMPGGSPTFRDSYQIEALYDDLECLFSEARRSFQGRTLREHHQRVAAPGNTPGEAEFSR
jgi:hypothetical protein